MRTPREILFAKHRPAEPQLDSIRRAVVEELARQKAKQPSPVLFALLWFPRKMWQELIWPSRRIWAGFAAAWLVIVAANLVDRPERAALGAGTKPQRAQVLMAWEQQQKLLVTLLSDTDGRDAERPKPVPRPRSNCRAIMPIG